MKYDKEFEEWYKKEAGYSGDIQACMYSAWQAARKDHYRIGEEASVWDGAPEWATKAVINWSAKTHYSGVYKEYTRTLPKSRIDEIAEEAEDKYRRGAVGAGSLTDIIKSAILQARKEWEAER